MTTQEPTRHKTTNGKQEPAGEPALRRTTHRPEPEARAHGPRARTDGIFIVPRGPTSMQEGRP